MTPPVILIPAGSTQRILYVASGDRVTVSAPGITTESISFYDYADGGGTVEMMFAGAAKDVDSDNSVRVLEGPKTYLIKASIALSVHVYAEIADTEPTTISDV